jgi:hypothetical protein
MLCFLSSRVRRLVENWLVLDCPVLFLAGYMLGGRMIAFANVHVASRSSDSTNTGNDDTGANHVRRTALDARHTSTPPATYEHGIGETF